jgi:hypothetical protein
VVFRRACLFERHFNPQALLGVGPCPLRPALKTVAVPPGPERSTSLAPVPGGGLPEPQLSWLTSDQVGIPAELKHINKRRTSEDWKVLTY